MFFQRTECCNFVHNSTPNIHPRSGGIEGCVRRHSCVGYPEQWIDIVKKQANVKKKKKKNTPLRMYFFGLISFINDNVKKFVVNTEP